MFTTPFKLFFPLFPSLFVSVPHSLPRPCVSPEQRILTFWNIFAPICFEVVGLFGKSVQSQQRHLERLYLSLYHPVSPPLRECWLFYQHPNVEFWSNSLCVPNIAAGLGGDVFMTQTLIATCRGKMFICGIWLALATPLSGVKGSPLHASVFLFGA